MDNYIHITNNWFCNICIISHHFEIWTNMVWSISCNNGFDWNGRQLLYILGTLVWIAFVVIFSVILCGGCGFGAFWFRRYRPNHSAVANVFITCYGFSIIIIILISVHYFWGFWAWVVTQTIISVLLCCGCGFGIWHRQKQAIGHWTQSTALIFTYIICFVLITIINCYIIIGIWAIYVAAITGLLTCCLCCCYMVEYGMRNAGVT
eukprot:314362_1